MALNKMFIPTFIANAEFQPAQVRPRMFFYNSITFRIVYRSNINVIKLLKEGGWQDG